MWNNEMIFSVGDITSANELYLDIISDNYNDDFSERLEHIKNMISRLEFEKMYLEGVINETKV